MGAEVEFFGNWVRVSIIFGGVKSMGRSRGENRSEAVEFESTISLENQFGTICPGKIDMIIFRTMQRTALVRLSPLKIYITLI